MKKFYGEKHWYETLYHWTLDGDDIEWLKEDDKEKKYIKIGDSEFYLLAPPYHDSDKNSTINFDIFFTGGFDDTNLFIIDTEDFNWCKKRRI
jgi:hypothetical protein